MDYARDYEMYRNGSVKQYGNQHVEFKTETVIDPVATEKANGQPKYKEIELLIVHNGRERTPVEVTERHKREYAAQYAAFKANREQPVEGTPLAEWAMIPRPIVAELAHYGIKTVEQLAEPAGDLKKKIGPLQPWVKKAKEWLAAANATQSQVVTLQEQLEKASIIMKKQEEQIALLQQRIDAIEGR